MTELQQKIHELHKLGMRNEDIALRLHCAHNTVYRTVREIKAPGQMQRIISIENAVYECLAILRQLTKLPKSALEARIKELEQQAHEAAVTKVVKP